MTVVTTVFCASCTSLAHRQRARREHLVAVDDRTVGIGEQRPIGVAVERDTGVGAEADHRLGHDLRVEGAAPVVDVLAVGLVVDGVHLGPEAPQQRPGAIDDAAPFAQSTTTRRPSRRASAACARWVR